MRKGKGYLAEQIFVAEAMRNGLNISRPVNPQCRYDFIAEKEGELFKIQVKSTNADPYSIKNQGYQINTKTPKGEYCESMVDFFVIYIFLANRFYLIPYSKIDTSKKSVFIRTLAKDCQYKAYFNNWGLLQ